MTSVFATVTLSGRMLGSLLSAFSTSLPEVEASIGSASRRILHRVCHYLVVNDNIDYKVYFLPALKKEIIFL